jgi:hypothetical protein
VSKKVGGFLVVGSKGDDSPGITNKAMVMFSATILAFLIYVMNQLFSEVTKLILPGLIAIGKS